MKGSLRLLQVRVQHVGVLGERLVTLGPFVPGINVISGPNESGKSTVVRALRAALFQRHGSKHETIKSLQPRSNRKAAPRVEVEFELDGTRYLLEKQFLHGVSARLQSADGAVSLRDDEADQRLFALLGAREPGKKVVADDMGVWSLLWVNQDAFATSEPAEQMGPHVRGTLAESIGSIVGDVMGGEHGIPLRRAIEEAFASVWTPQAGRPTGKLLAAREAHEGLTAEVAELERRVRQTEALGADLGRMEDDLATLREEGARLADDLAACERAATAAEATERGHADAAARLAEAERAHAEARGARVAREKQRNDLAALEASARALGETHAPLAREAERRAVQAREAEYAEATARGERDRVQRSVFELGDAIARAKVREDLARAAEALAEARRLTARIEACAGERRGLPDEDALREMRELEAQRSIVAEHVRRHATRVTLHRPGSEPVETTVTRREVVALAELGSLTLEPPREGFLRAREAWREVRSTLATPWAARRGRSPSVGGASTRPRGRPARPSARSRRRGSRSWPSRSSGRRPRARPRRRISKPRGSRARRSISTSSSSRACRWTPPPSRASRRWPRGWRRWRRRRATRRCG